MDATTAQLTLNFEPGRLEQHPTLLCFLRHRVTSKPGGKPEKAIAAELDLSPSDLSRKLSGNPNDPRCFTVNDLENYIRATGDVEPVYYLVEKFLESADSRRDRALAQIPNLVDQLNRLMRQAAPEQVVSLPTRRRARS